MPFFGLGLHFLVAIYFAVHAVRTGQQTYWLFILFSFPLLGSVVYFVSIYLPASRLERGTKRVLSAAVKVLDPTRELREATAAFDYTPTAQNQIRLAQALLNAGDAKQAAINYEACLKGPFAADPEIRLGAARAFVECGNFAQAVTHLRAVQASHPDFRAEQVALLLARTLQGAGDTVGAKAAFEQAVARFGSFEARAEYAIWAIETGEQQLAQALKTEIERVTRHWNRHNRELNAPMLKRLALAFKQ
ncbi:hypothetical protein SAMN02745857_01489 [Andreprevotia lacus DSM 23236]|jgi:hypothetical protein|uniref:Tetratricopeptide repeat-containing protein n=1 Tax=Andreprevotia lacus DSM 23236 TaxID=1121001 RepID=A0A1W1XH60_9NEIS|nr:tetratricopeptide repeat protein [Andreprevotia lacus]SMC22848.1 hypothetical protein SAMN02745857_01489 [Andreprevotia lacus DSM 23236]